MAIVQSVTQNLSDWRQGTLTNLATTRSGLQLAAESLSFDDVNDYANVPTSSALT